MLCKFGCGKLGLFGTTSGLQCAKHHMTCSAIRNKVGSANKGKLIGRVRSEEAKQNISDSLKTAYASGKRVVSEEQKLATSIRFKEQWTQRSRSAWNKGVKGQIPWNKGHKKRTPVDAPKDDVFASLQRYRNRVSVRTQRTYEIYKDEINPHNFPRGKCGVDGVWQLDHIISVREGFEKRIPVDVIADKSNLQMLPWLDNLRKYDK